MLFFHVLLLFILGTFAIAAPVGPVWLLGSPQQEGRSSCIGKTICALLGWHAPNLPEPPEEEIWRLVAGYWYSKRPRQSRDDVIQLGPKCQPCLILHPAVPIHVSALKFAVFNGERTWKPVPNEGEYNRLMYSKYGPAIPIHLVDENARLKTKIQNNGELDMDFMVKYKGKNRLASTTLMIRGIHTMPIYQ